MKIITSIALFFAFSALSINRSMASHPRNLSEFKWANRIILVHLPLTSENPISLLTAAEAELKERDLVWFVFKEDALTTNYAGVLGEAFRNAVPSEFFPDAAYGVCLIGKDGGVKRRADHLDLKELFALIDSMPMRILEMNRDRS